MLKVPCASVAGAHLCSALGKLCVHHCGIKEDKQGPRLAGVHSLLGNRHRGRSLQCRAAVGSTVIDEGSAVEQTAGWLCATEGPGQA